MSANQSAAIVYALLAIASITNDFAHKGFIALAILSTLMATVEQISARKRKNP